MVEPARRVELAFRERFGRRPEVVAWAPGRINIIGEHTDYLGGLAMPAAIDRWVAVALAAGPNEVHSLDLGSTWRGGRPTNSWQRYVSGCLSVFQAPTVAAVFGGDVPAGAGISSSAALTLAWMNGLRALTGRALDDLDLCRLAQRVEHEHLGVPCGLLDQVASQLSREGHLLVVDFSADAVRYVPAVADGLCWIALHTGVKRELAASAYATRVAECARELEAIRARHPEVRVYRDVTLATATGRLRHMVAENARVVAAAESRDGARLGALLLESHASLRDIYEVSCPELDRMVEMAAAQPACLGARLMGGGFGGCTLNLVRVDGASDFVASVLARYRARLPWEARGYRFDLVGGAGAVSC